MFTKTALTKLHRFSFGNEDSVHTSKKCGCFYCLKIFDPKEITEWIREEENAKTALCPYCGIDAVLGDSTVELTPDLLQAMHEKWF